MPGQLRPRGVTMRDCLKNRAGFDRVLMAVAATFLTVSATSALAQAEPGHRSAAELAIDQAARKLIVTAETDRLLVQNFARRLTGDDTKGGQN